MNLSNPNRANQGGDVEGFDSTTVDHGLAMGGPLRVAKASYVAGYRPNIETSYGFSMIQIKTGYASYGEDKTGSSED